jgi:hypothetical protein
MDAIEQRDGDAAWRRMGRHVGAYVEAVDKRSKEAAAQRLNRPSSASRKNFE